MSIGGIGGGDDLRKKAALAIARTRTNSGLGRVAADLQGPGRLPESSVVASGGSGKGSGVATMPDASKGSGDPGSGDSPPALDMEV